MPVEITEKTIIYSCGSFKGEVVTVGGEVNSVYINGESEGRGMNRIIIKNNFGTSHDLHDLLELVQEMIQCGVR